MALFQLTAGEVVVGGEANLERTQSGNGVSMHVYQCMCPDAKSVVGVLLELNEVF
jgi:hypothetical protein